MPPRADRMHLLIEHKRSTATGMFGSSLSQFLLGLEGRKQWSGANELRFETTEANLRLFRAFWPDAETKDQRALANSIEDGLGSIVMGSDGENYLRTQKRAPLPKIEPNFRVAPYPFQLRAYEQFREAPVFAMFGEQGTGKSKTIIDIICYRWKAQLLTGVVIFAPKGVHTQWVEELFPEHMWKDVPYWAEAWNGRRWTSREKWKPARELQILTANHDMVKSARSRSMLWPFVQLHADTGSGRTLAVGVDESQAIKNASARRSDEIRKFGLQAQQRFIMTGTPIAKDLTDEWSQFKFLDERIIGQKYKTAFQAQYCIIGGFDGRTVTGHRNIEGFNRLVAPYIFRVTKADELDLPPKVYANEVFELTDEQKRHMKNLKESFLTQLDNGEITSVLNAASMLVRVQQITCGYIVDDTGAFTMLEVNPRLDALEHVAEHREGKKIIWCRFNRDVELLKARYGKRAVTYYGPTSHNDRELAKRSFLDPDSDIEFFIGSPAAAGTGLNLQGACRTAIYYSNSFNAIDRWQSEDRIHRIGTTGTVTYFDLIARGSFDRKILANLRAKKSLSDLVLDDVRRIWNELGTE